MLFLKYKFGWGPLDVGIALSMFGLTYCISQVRLVGCTSLRQGSVLTRPHTQGLLIRYFLKCLGDRKTLLLAMFLDAVRRTCPQLGR